MVPLSVSSSPLLSSILSHLFPLSFLTSSKSPPPPGHRWFEFNDTHVSPILAKSLEKMYQGKQSAYMLFYRRKTLQRPPEGNNGSGGNCIVLPMWPHSQASLQPTVLYFIKPGEEPRTRSVHTANGIS